MATCWALSIVAIVAITRMDHGQAALHKLTNAVNDQRQPRCILIIGGYRQNSSSQIYSPSESTDDCYGRFGIGGLPTLKLLADDDASGCYLPETNELILRECWNRGTAGRSDSALFSLSSDKKSIQADVRNPLSEKISGSASSYVEGVCRSCGGCLPNRQKVDVCFEYRPNERQWVKMASMPQRLIGAVSVTVGDNYYIIGGYDDSQTTTNRVSVYSTAKGGWYPVSPMRQQRVAHCAVQLSDIELMVCGGWNSTSRQLLDSCEIYNTINDQWRAGPALSPARSSFQMLSIDGVVYAMGGETDAEKETASVQQLLLADRDTAVTGRKWIWTNAKHLQTPRAGFMAVTI